MNITVHDSLCSICKVTPSAIGTKWAQRHKKNATPSEPCIGARLALNAHYRSYLKFHRIKNRERLIERDRAAQQKRLEADPERVRAMRRAVYQNRDPLKSQREDGRGKLRHRQREQTDPEYKAKNTKRRREYWRQRYQSDPEFRKTKLARNSRRFQRLRTDIAKRDEWKCCYCYTDVSEDFHIDHAWPRSRANEYDGNIDSIENLVLSCPSCNLSKGNRTAEEFRHGT